MPRTKKTAVKKKEPTLEQLVQQQVQEQLQEALLNIEFDTPEQSTDAFVDMDLLREEIKKEVEFAYKTKQHKEEVVKESKTELTRSELKLSADKEFLFTSGLDGLVISEKDKALITASKSGAIGFGLKAPRSFGIGSAHFRANYPSEAPIPTSGDGSTRGVIVEGDGDDEKTYAFRVLSRMNRQGFNVTSDGSLIINDSTDKTQSRVSINQTDNDAHALNVIGSSRYYDQNIVNLQSKATPDENFNFLNAKADVENNGDAGVDVFRVDGEGSVYANIGVNSNARGYAELFEWADGNHKNENRNGFTVSLNEKGQLVVADEGDAVIGVVSDSAALIGNAGWNCLQNRFNLDANKDPMKSRVKIVEWLDDVGVLHSHYLHTLSKEFALPDNAIIYETNENGDDILKQDYRSDFDMSKDYTKRIKRGWACVIITGTTKVFKGQFMGSNWVKIKDINDDLEEWIIK